MTESARLDDAFDARFRFLLDDIHTFFPARIIRVRPESGLVDVQPNLKVVFPGETAEIELPVINNVVLMNLRSEGVIIRVPSETLIDTKVGVFIAEHSLTEWRQKAGESSLPEEARRFDINDAVAVLGLYPETIPFSIPQLPNTFEILGQAAKGVKFRIGTEAADLVGLTYQILLLMSAGTDPVTGQFLNIAQITPLLTLFSTIVNPIS